MNMLDNIEYIIEDIETIECVGEFEDEYVYDIEVDDDTHTFIGNDILVHNSLYISYTPIIKSTEFIDNELKFILHMNSVFTQPLFNKYLEEYAIKYGVKNLHDFELETINKSALHIQKKHYITNVVFEDGVFFEDLSHFSATGVEIVKSSTPSFVRENIWGFINYLFKDPDNVNIKEILKIMKKLKKEFKMADIEDIAMTTNLSNYEHRVIDDQNSIECVKGAHFSVKAAALHNFLLNKNTSFKTKYDLLRGGRIKWYFTKNEYNMNRFAYLRSFHPTEITIKEGIDIDYDEQFSKTFLSIANKFINPIGLPEINKRLSVLNSLFSPNKKQKKQIKIEKLEDEDFINVISSNDLDYLDDALIQDEEETSITEIKKEKIDKIDKIDKNDKNDKNEEYDDFWN